MGKSIWKCCSHGAVSKINCLGLQNIEQMTRKKKKNVEMEWDSRITKTAAFRDPLPQSL